MRVVLGAVLFVGCGQDIGISSNPPPPPAEPPGDNSDGRPPNWQDCFGGWRGEYHNLSIDHPDVLPGQEDKLAKDPVGLDWWSRESFQKYDATLDFGLNWWPIDEELEGDPAYFAVKWDAWIRVWDDTTLQFALGSSDDSWVLVDGEPVAANPGVQEFKRENIQVDLDAGQFPIEVYFAHRGSETAGMSFRVVSGDVSICYPDFSEEEESP